MKLPCAIGLFLIAALYMVSDAGAGLTQQSGKKTTTGAQAKAQAQSIVDKGMAFEKAKKYADALSQYTAAIALGDSHNLALGRRGVLLAKMGRREAALADLTEAISSGAKEYDLYITRGSIYLSAEKEQAAIKDFKQALELKPGDQAAICGLAELYGSTMQYGLAIKYLTLIINQPKWVNWDFYRKRGDDYLLINKPAEAVADLSKVLAMYPQARKVHEARCEAYAQLKNYKAAIADCTVAIRQTDLPGYLYTKRAKLYKSLGEDKLAAQDQAEAAKLSRDLFDDAPFRVKQKQHQ